MKQALLLLCTLCALVSTNIAATQRVFYVSSIEPVTNGSSLARMTNSAGQGQSATNDIAVEMGVPVHPENGSAFLISIRQATRSHPAQGQIIEVSRTGNLRVFFETNKPPAIKAFLPGGDLLVGWEGGNARVGRPEAGSPPVVKWSSNTLYAGVWHSFTNGNLLYIENSYAGVVDGETGAILVHTNLPVLAGVGNSTIRALDNGSFLLAGEKLQPWSQVENGVSDYGIYLAAIRPDFSTLWQKQIGGAGHNFLADVLVGNGTFDVCAAVVASGTMLTNYGYKDAAIVQFDLAGNELNQVVFGTHGEDYVLDAYRHSDGKRTLRTSFGLVTVSSNLTVMQTNSGSALFFSDEMGGATLVHPEGDVLRTDFIRTELIGKQLKDWPAVFTEIPNVGFRGTDGQKIVEIRSFETEADAPILVDYTKPNVGIIGPTNYTSLSNSISLTVHGTRPGWHVFYTTDGSKPRPSSELYRGAIVLQTNATVRVAAYSVNYSLSVEGRAINIQLTPKTPEYKLSLPWMGGGRLEFDPNPGSSGGPMIFPSNTVVSITANPYPGSGSVFVRWAGDAVGTNSTVSVLMDRPKTVWPAFAAPIATPTEGSGTIIIEGAPGPYYFDQLRVYAVPGEGYKFEEWGLGLQGGINTNRFFHATPGAAIYALFVPAATNEVTMTAMAFGQGDVEVIPHQSTYTLGQRVRVKAKARPGASFLGWTHDANGRDAEIEVVLDRNKSVSATFAAWTSVGFMMDVARPEGIWDIKASSDLQNWETVKRATNTIGVIHFEDPYSVVNPGRFYKLERVE